MCLTALPRPAVARSAGPGFHLHAPHAPSSNLLFTPFKRSMGFLMTASQDPTFSKMLQGLAFLSLGILHCHPWFGGNLDSVSGRAARPLAQKQATASVQAPDSPHADVGPVTAFLCASVSPSVKWGHNCTYLIGMLGTMSTAGFTRQLCSELFSRGK